MVKDMCRYMKQLFDAYIASGHSKDIGRIMEGKGKEEDIQKIKAKYPEVPEVLIALFREMDGSIVKDNGRIYRYPVFVTEGIPYALMSTQKILDWKVPSFMDAVFTFADGEGNVDERIKKGRGRLNWLHFANAVGGGILSQLFIDFSPSDKGNVGQIIRYSYDECVFTVIADNFYDYIDMVLDDGFSFLD